MRSTDPDRGYATTVVRQMEDCLHSHAAGGDDVDAHRHDAVVVEQGTLRFAGRPRRVEDQRIVDISATRSPLARPARARAARSTASSSWA